MVRKSILLLTPLLLLAGCNRGEQEAPDPADSDPAMADALGDQIMVDPDLVGQNRANNAASVGSEDGTLPARLRSPQALAESRADALKLVGGPGAMKKAPQAERVSGSLPADSALTAAARAAASPGGKGDCAAQARYTAQWAAKLPATFPVYPRGAVQEAAGTDEGDCALRVVNFTTPVPVSEVIDFYYTRANAAGFTAQHVMDGKDNVIGGTKGSQSFMVYARPLAGGGTSVDLVTHGG